jgi:2-polyprenyl-3-methyl-5-hydroxy-6-metoxy-1,4-benzoquinol methylase
VEPSLISLGAWFVRESDGMAVTSPKGVKRPDRRSGRFLQPSWVNPGSHRSRFDQLRPYFCGRSVLDVGCASGWKRPDWFHALIAEEAAEIVGVDVDAQAVRELAARGHHVVLGDATEIELGRCFDVVHAGELIEHLDNPRAFLNAAKRHLRPDSLLILSTPNPFCVTNFIYRLGGRAKLNRDHQCWYCEDTLRQLLERNGFTPLELRYLRHRTPGRLRAGVSSLLRATLPDRLAWNTILVVARIADD